MYKNGWKLGKGSGNERVGEKEVTEYLNKLTDLKNAPAYEVQEELGDYYENLGDVTGELIEKLKDFFPISQQWLGTGTSEPQWKRLVTNSVWSTDLVASYNNYKKLILSGSSEDHQLVDQLLGQKTANWLTNLFNGDERGLKFRNYYQSADNSKPRDGLTEAARYYQQYRSNQQGKKDGLGDTIFNQLAKVRAEKGGGKFDPLNARSVNGDVTYEEFIASIDRDFSKDKSKDLLKISREDFNHLYAFQDYVLTDVVTDESISAVSANKYARDGLSMAADLVPVLGTIKGIQELITGDDWITGEEVPRWVSAIGLAGGMLGPIAKFSASAAGKISKALEGIQLGQDFINKSLLREGLADLTRAISSSQNQILAGLKEANSKFVESLLEQGYIKRNGMELAFAYGGDFNKLADKAAAGKLDELYQFIKNVSEKMALKATDKSFKALRDDAQYFSKRGLTVVTDADQTWTNQLTAMIDKVKKADFADPGAKTDAINALKKVQETMKKMASDKKLTLSEMRPDILSFKVIKDEKGRDKLYIEIGEFKSSDWPSTSYDPRSPSKNEAPQLNNYAAAKSEFDKALKDADINFETHITYFFLNNPQGEKYMKLFNEQNAKNKSFKFNNIDSPMKVNYLGPRGGKHQYYIVSTDKDISKSMLE